MTLHHLNQKCPDELGPGRVSRIRWEKITPDCVSNQSEKSQLQPSYTGTKEVSRGREAQDAITLNSLMLSVESEIHFNTQEMKMPLLWKPGNQSARWRRNTNVRIEFYDLFLRKQGRQKSKTSKYTSVEMKHQALSRKNLNSKSILRLSCKSYTYTIRNWILWRTHGVRSYPSPGSPHPSGNAYIDKLFIPNFCMYL